MPVNKSLAKNLKKKYGAKKGESVYFGMEADAKPAFKKGMKTATKEGHTAKSMKAMKAKPKVAAKKKVVAKKRVGRGDDSKSQLPFGEYGEGVDRQGNPDGSYTNRRGRNAQKSTDMGDYRNPNSPDYVNPGKGNSWSEVGQGDDAKRKKAAPKRNPAVKKAAPKKAVAKKVVKKKAPAKKK